MCLFQFHRSGLNHTYLDEGEKRGTAEQGGAGRFMVKWIAAEKARAGLRHAVVCPNAIMTGRTKETTA